MIAARATAAVAETNLRIWRQGWYGSLTSMFLSPVLFLAALGLGLGRLVEPGAGFDGVDYVTFLAPGLLAGTAFQTAAQDSSWQLRGRIRWDATFVSVVATPVTVADLIAGHLVGVLARVTAGAVVFAVVAALFGASSVGRLLLAVGPAVLTGLAMAAPVAAFTAWVEADEHLATLFRFVLVPAFLLSGTFFPPERLPVVLETVIAVLPLWHGVALARAVALGSATPWPAVFHILVLLSWIAVGAPLAARYLGRRLLK